jgi:hypothetical protein
MLTFFKRLFKSASTNTIAPKAAPELTLSQVNDGLRLLRKHFHFDLFKMLGGVTRIQAVKCPTKFGGWGYVEGRTSGVRVDPRITIVEADDDMEFTEVCVLIDNLPCLLIEEGYHANVAKSGLSVTVIVERDYLESVLSPGHLWCSTLEDYEQLPMPVKSVMLTIISRMYDYHYNRTTGLWRDQDAVEKVLSYAIK